MANISSRSDVIVIDASVQQTVYTQYIKVARRIPDDNIVMHGAKMKDLKSDLIPLEISDEDLRRAPMPRRVLGILGERKSEPGISVYFRSADVIKKVYEALVGRDGNRDGKIDEKYAALDLEIDLEQQKIDGIDVPDPDALDEVAQSQKMERIHDFLIEYRNSVFTVTVTQDDTGGGSGTGFLVDKKGDGKGGFDYLVMTNAHVVDSTWMSQLQMQEQFENAVSLSTKDGNITIDGVEIAGTDPLRDIAILKFNSSLDLPVLPFGKSSELRLLDDLVSYGNSLGNDMRPAVGALLDERFFGLNSVTELTVLRTAPIGIGGNSGGPIFNEKGNVVGVMDAMIQRSEVTQLPYQDSFLIPIEDALNSMQMILDGNVHYGDWGMNVGYLGRPELSAILPGDLPKTGVQVSKVSQDGPAGNAGLRAGDIIVSVNGDSKVVSTKNGWDQINKFHDLVRRSHAGMSFTLKVYRDSEKKTFETTVVSQDKTFARSNTTKTGLGLFVQDVSADLRDLYGISDDVHGVLVVHDMSKRGANLQYEIITQVNGRDVSDVKSFIDALEAVKKSGKKTITVMAVPTVLGYSRHFGGMQAKRLVTLDVN